MAKATHKIVATVGKYTDRQTGEEKKRYLQCGVAFTDEQGRISLKIDAMPVTPDWSGFLSLYPLDDDRRNNDAPAPRPQPQPARRPATTTRKPPPGTIEYPPPETLAEGMEEESIPF